MFDIQIFVAGDTHIEGITLGGIATLPWRKLHLQENGMQGSIPDELSSGSPAKIGLEELWLQNSTFERDVTDWFGRPMTTTLPQCFGIFGFPTTMVFEETYRHRYATRHQVDLQFVTCGFAAKGNKSEEQA